MIKFNSNIKKDSSYDEKLAQDKAVINTVIREFDAQYTNDLGWKAVDEWASEKILNDINEIATEIRENADVFILIGVGGSNQGARAMIKALQKKNDKVEVVYAGNNLDGRYLTSLLEDLEGKSVYANVIAKNFATLEPGIHFRVIRKWMEERYSKEECAKRIIATGTLGSSLNDLSDLKGYRMLPFPNNVGGRYSVITPVGLLPIAVAGLDIKEFTRGAKDLLDHLTTCDDKDNMVVDYCNFRKLAHGGKTSNEILSNFDTRLEFFMKWWVQLYGESQGKDDRGIFPVACNYTEDLHAMGQYMQDGRKDIIETFIKIEENVEYIKIDEESTCKDYFEYLDGKCFYDLNNGAYKATVLAHSQGGVPCSEVVVPKLNEYYFGQLFYFFMIGCYLSSEFEGMNAFDQPGVEAYKMHMFEILGKNK